MIHYKETAQITRKDLDYLYSSVGWLAYTNNLDRLKDTIDNSLSVITA